MPTGERPQGRAAPSPAFAGERPRRRCMRRAPPGRGFTYLVLLFMIALGGAALGAIGTQWQAAAQRERETELLFRGRQIAQALGRYAAATPPGQPRAPLSLDELLEDRRSDPPRHHLRRLYADPFTGLPDWQTITDSRGRILGLHSRATQRAWRRHDLPIPNSTPTPTQTTPTVADWRFMTEAGPAPEPRRTP